MPRPPAIQTRCYLAALHAELLARLPTPTQQPQTNGLLLPPVHQYTPPPLPREPPGTRHISATQPAPLLAFASRRSAPRPVRRGACAPAVTHTCARSCSGEQGPARANGPLRLCTASIHHTCMLPHPRHSLSTHPYTFPPSVTHNWPFSLGQPRPCAQRCRGRSCALVPRTPLLPFTIPNSCTRTLASLLQPGRALLHCLVQHAQRILRAKERRGLDGGSGGRRAPVRRRRGGRSDGRLLEL